MVLKLPGLGLVGMSWLGSGPDGEGRVRVEVRKPKLSLKAGSQGVIASQTVDSSWEAGGWPQLGPGLCSDFGQ